MLGKRRRVIEPAPPKVAGWDAEQLRSSLNRLADRHAMLNLLITGYEYTIRFEGREAEPQDTFVGLLKHPAAFVEGNIVADGNDDCGLGHVTLTARDGVNGGSVTPNVDVVVTPTGQAQIATIRDAVSTTLCRGGQAWLNMKLQLVTNPELEYQHMVERGYSSSLFVEHVIFGTSIGEPRL
jgi:hypothetical protein